MPPRLLPLPRGPRQPSSSSTTRASYLRTTPSRCLFCTFSPSLSPRYHSYPSRNDKPQRSRPYSSSTPTASTPSSSGPRESLSKSLLALQKRAPRHVNPARLSLALRNLQQEPGSETIRVAILAVPAVAPQSSRENGSSISSREARREGEKGESQQEMTGGGTGGGRSSQAAKRVLKALLQDPLSDQAGWEAEIESHDLSSTPLVVKVGRKSGQGDAAVGMGQQEESRVEFQMQKPGQEADGAAERLRCQPHEMHVDSPMVSNLGVEFLAMESGGFQGVQEQDLENVVLVPTLDGKSATPVHKSIIVSDGLLGAANLLNLPLSLTSDTVTTASEIPEYTSATTAPLLGNLTVLNLSRAQQGVEAMRESVSNASLSQTLLTSSGVNTLSAWLKRDIIVPYDEGNATKPAVKTLVSSLLLHAEKSIDMEVAARQLKLNQADEARQQVRSHLARDVAIWAENAHSELQDNLDVAFGGKRWQKLGWWKLFWRVDDVGMIATEMLGRWFLADAERRCIFLAGKIEEAGLFEGCEDGERGFLAPRKYEGEIEEGLVGRTGVKMVMKEGKGMEEAKGKKTSETPVPEAGEKYSIYPTNIGHTRTYLVTRTVPALQALAQRLVLQTASSTATTTALGVLMYLSSFSLEAAGAVAALGCVLSLRRLQGKWEGAREFWEAEVREEGRKAVRSVEVVVGDVFVGRDGRKKEVVVEDELDRAKEAVGVARGWLEKLK